MTTAVLSCTELLDIICQHCDRHTLTQLSTTNRWISYSALDVQWSSVENLGPLIRCMPEDLWEERFLTMSGGRWSYEPNIYTNMRRLSFHRPIRKTDWERFLLNSVRVRTVGLISGNISYDIESDTYWALCRAAIDNDNLKLLPHVQQFDVRLLSMYHDNRNELASPYIHCFLSSTITKIGIDLSTKSRLTMIPTLIEQCPFVDEAVLVGLKGNQNDEGVEFVKAVNLMRHWPHLQALFVRDVHPMAVLALSSFPYLKALQIEGIKSDDYRTLSPSPPPPPPPPPPTTLPNHGFPHLQHLIIDDYTKSNFIFQLVNNMHQTPLVSLEIHFWDLIPLDRWLELVTIIVRNIHPEYLQSISIYFGVGQKFSDPVSIKTVGPLLDFTHLKYVFFMSLLGNNPDDETVDAMARSWNNLENFGIEMFSRSPPRATWKSLISLAKHSPQLETLALQFDATTISKQIFDQKHPQSAPWKDIRNETLRVLHVYRSPIECPNAVAQFISQVFPNVETINVTLPSLVMDPGWDNMSGKWAEVERLLHASRKPPL
ncbi:hypothetical protein AX15_005444 [Amanita polypyramis BW_CC]|nr:hypothetical protein AX15_005444 [Amanita polypyramis BW_CC]